MINGNRVIGRIELSPERCGKDRSTAGSVSRCS